MIRVSDLWFRYENSDQWVLKGIDLEVGQGDIVLIFGPNGCGKSTFARLLSGLITFYRGEVRGSINVYGVDVIRDAERAVEVIGYVSEDPESQIMTQTVMDELVLPPLNLGYDYTESLGLALDAAKITGIEHLLGRSTFELSIGEAQRVVLASALSMKPRALVLDEPLAYLDNETSNQFIKYLCSYVSRGASAIIFENNFEKLIGNVSEAYELRNGKLFRVSEYELRQKLELLHSEPKVLRKFTYRRKPARGDVIVDFENVWVKYPGSTKWALEGVSLEVFKGEVLGLYGPNGSGKSTILKVIIGAVDIAKGSVRILTRDRKCKIAYVPQNPVLTLLAPTVRECLELVATHCCKSPARIREVAETLGLSDYYEESIMRLSLGMRRRLALAMALSSGAELVLLDEPTSALDSEARRDLMEMLHSIVLSDDITMVIASHDKELLNSVCTRIISLRDGHVVGEVEID